MEHPLNSINNANIAPLHPSTLSESNSSNDTLNSVSSGTAAVDSFSRRPPCSCSAGYTGVGAPGLNLPAPAFFNHDPASISGIPRAAISADSTASSETPLELSDYYEIFDSNEAAMESIHAINNRSSKPKAILPRPNSLYDGLDEAIAVVMDGYRELYPELVGDLPNPRSIIMEDPVLNAFVFNHNVNPSGKAPYYIIVNTGTLGAEISRSKLLGVMAHELAHLFFRHSRPEVREKLDKYYAVNGEKEPLGFEQENNPTVEKIVKAYVHAVLSGDRRRAHFMKSKFPLEKFRWYAPEEHADDISVRIMHSLGEDPLAIGEFNLHWLPSEEREACKARIAAGEPIAYGDLKNNHHTECWRYKHAMDLSKTLG